jgi:hypothetical protein
MPLVSERRSAALGSPLVALLAAACGTSPAGPDGAGVDTPTIDARATDAAATDTATPDGGSASDGGVHWLDPLGYTKPAFLPVAVPDEATCPNRYWVDQAAGSGSACTATAPCGWAGLAGKPGTTGGPAYVYLRGDARLELSATLFGAAGAEVVIVPWPGSHDVVTMASQGSNSRAGANTIAGNNVHHIVMDGGPDLLFSFAGRGPSTDQNNYTLIISSSNVTVARTRIHAGDGYGPTLGVATGSGSNVHDITWVNNEMYDSTHYYGVYTGGGTGCAAGDTSHQRVRFLNNVFRDICGRGIQIEPRASAEDTYVIGNVFHHVGYGECLGQVSAAVQPADACSGTIRGIHVENNLMFDLGGGGVTLVGDFQDVSILQNTIFDFARSTPLSTSSHGIGCYSDGCHGIVRNNIVVQVTAPDIDPLNRASGLTTQNNLCDHGCGGASQSGTAATVFASTDPHSPLFLTLAPGSPAIDHGYATGITTSYFGDTRHDPLDIGADEH